MQVDYVRVYKPADNTNAAGDMAAQKRSAARETFAGLRNGKIYLYLNSGTYNVELYNLRGRLVASQRFRAADGLNVVSVSAGGAKKLTTGTYVLNIKQGGVSVAAKSFVLTF